VSACFLVHCNSSEPAEEPRYRFSDLFGDADYRQCGWYAHAAGRARVHADLPDDSHCPDKVARREGVFRYDSCWFSLEGNHAVLFGTGRRPKTLVIRLTAVIFACSWRTLSSLEDGFRNAFD
jgi:hypothetical protein